jgi:hypothetical protein
MGSLCTEVALISASLSQVQSVLEAKPDNQSSEKSLIRPEIINAFDVALTGCAVVLSCIDYEIQNIKTVEIGKDLDWKAKAKALWKEDTMKELTTQLRGQYTAMGILIQTMQM